MAKKKSKKEDKKTKKSEKNNGFDIGLSRETKNGIWGVVSFGGAVVTTLSFLGIAGVAGDMFADFAGSLFGWGIFLIPLSLVLVGVSFFKSVSRKLHFSIWSGMGVFLLSFLAMFYIFAGTSTKVTYSGYLGFILGYPLEGLVGFTASFVVLLLMVFISFLVVMDIPAHSLMWWRKEEEEDGKTIPVLSDKIVIKRGNEIVDQAKEELEQKRLKAVTAVAKKPVEKDEEKEFIIKASKSGAWVLPPLEILHSDKERPNGGDVNANASIIKRTLSNFNIDVEMGEVAIGPTVTQFTLRPAIGVKLSKIEALHKDLSLALAAHPIRIEAPIPGKSLVGIEIPNKKSAIVGLREMIESEDYQKSKYLLPLVLGRDVAGFPVYGGIEKMPHLLIAGATGTGKSVGINSLLMSLLYKHSPETLRLILVDPKGVELTLYNDIPHLVCPVITDPKKVVNALKWAVREMDKRYDRLQQAKARDILSYNVQQAGKKEDLMPAIVIVIDELADIMAAYGRDVEAAIVRLAQMSRAVGIHLVVSTQRPSVEVITGLIKANIPSRAAFQVASQIDSRTILDASGAEKLLGNGDMLYQSGDMSKPRRLQGAFVTEKEVKDVVKFLKQQADKMEETKPEAISGMQMDIETAVAGGSADDEDAGDDLYGEAKEVVAQAGKASASLLQRRLKVGYARAARLLDLLEERGIIGPGEGAKPREVYIGQEGRPQSRSGYIDDGSMPEVVTASAHDEKLDEKIATEE